MVLDEVFRRLNKEGIEVLLNDSEPKGVYCRYGKNVTKVVETNDGLAVETIPEMLEVGVPDEKIIVEHYFTKFSINYNGKCPRSMLKTLRDLRLPSWDSDNLGEWALISCRKILEDYMENNPEKYAGTISIMLKPGKERHLVYILNKVLKHYNAFFMPQQI